MSIRQQREIETLKEKVADLESRYDRLLERVNHISLDSLFADGRLPPLSELMDAVNAMCEDKKRGRRSKTQDA